jgi:hypothetical protein
MIRVACFGGSALIEMRGQSDSRMQLLISSIAQMLLRLSKRRPLISMLGSEEMPKGDIIAYVGEVTMKLAEVVAALRPFILCCALDQVCRCCT